MHYTKIAPGSLCLLKSRLYTWSNIHVIDDNYINGLMGTLIPITENKIITVIGVILGSKRADIPAILLLSDMNLSWTWHNLLCESLREI